MPIAEVGVGLAEGRPCGFKVNEAIAASHIRRGVGAVSFSAEELTQAMLSVTNAETVSAWVGTPTTAADHSRVCANILGQFGANGTIIPGLLSK